MESMTSPGTLLSRDNAIWLEEYYQTWLHMPEKLPEDWRRFLLSPELTVQSVSGDSNVNGVMLKKTGYGNTTDQCLTHAGVSARKV